ncbi:hypothetical protein OLZ33_22625 [Pantoea ananatis]|uniref:hypothetical protein n=2 Tax=Pantoea TaxID=53335 RepID=UPI0015888FD5|nr:hypothetical protein [Pantoea ananatis]MBA4824022.1 hypothetical protein [Pantoea ananatis]MCW1834765.1 hypothetical protein [Pantoea ananatis]QKV89763.1 hypothetical protein FOB88_22835 [Pantoea ananatis]
MAKHLDKKDISIIKNTIAGWDSEKSGKLSWEYLCDRLEPLIGKRPTRQSLGLHEDIVMAFNIKKKNIKSGNDEEKRPANLKMASQRISNLEFKNKVLAEELRSLEERFVVWQFNAINYGISYEQLNNGLPKIDRETNAD